MYILSQDKKKIVCFSEGILSVGRNIGGGKDGKFAVFVNGLEILGVYSEEKNAIDELEKIFNAAEEGKTTYIMN